ncbi:hypothetical protein [Mangrovicoccus ximenensis]|uniref:hypothetical protein n=1 Tax=Mangrovicoccus ximenensis TaxID=1911570 RepID=UPI001374ED65|nr:hypothetical protein [Mangrovicoccus ximenensis]
MAHEPDFDIDDAALDLMLAEARADAPLPSAALMARIGADAARVQAGQGQAAGRPARPPA